MLWYYRLMFCNLFSQMSSTVALDHIFKTTAFVVKSKAVPQKQRVVMEVKSWFDTHTRREHPGNHCTPCLLGTLLSNYNYIVWYFVIYSPKCDQSLHSTILFPDRKHSSKTPCLFSIGNSSRGLSHLDEILTQSVCFSSLFIVEL